MRRALCALLALMLAIAATPARAELGKDWLPAYPCARYMHTCVSFNGRLWMIGGTEVDQGAAKNDIWSSADGVQWRQELAAAPFSARWSHACVVFENRLWVIGGHDGVSNMTDVWSSPDGIHWIMETASVPFSPRSGTSCVVFNGQIWMLGGGSNPGNDIWRSSDGVHWTLVPAVNPFSSRFLHSCVVFHDKMWVIAGGQTIQGFPPISYFHDVWSSADGLNWTRETASAPFASRYAAFGIVFNDRIWIIGGSAYPYDANPKQDVWSSADGMAWRKEGDFPDGRDFLAGAAINGRIELIGGRAGSGPARDLLVSPDGAHWTEATSGFPYFRTDNPAVASFKGRLWMIGGSYGGGDPSNAVTASEDGVSWTTPLLHAPFSERSEAAGLVFNDRLWVIGGIGDTYKNDPPLNDVWSSPDGTTWTQATAAAPFPPRHGHAAAVFGDKMWVIGGSDAAGNVLTDVWSSSDGIQWTLATAAAPFSPRIQFGCAAFAGKLWVFGGSNRPYNTTADLYRNDVWSSPDGKNWTQETAAAAFPGRFGFASAVAGDKLWMIGGSVVDFPAVNEVWSSADGKTWTAVVAAPFRGRQSPAALVLNRRLWVFGGRQNSLPVYDAWFSDPAFNAAAGWRGYP